MDIHDKKVEKLEELANQVRQDIVKMLLAAGMAIYGKIPFISSYAVFSPGRNNEQIRTTISLNNVPVQLHD